MRMYFPSPSGFGGIGEVTGVDDVDAFDMIRWAISRGMILTGAIQLRLWRINSERAVSRVLRIRMCHKSRDKVRKSGSASTEADAFTSAMYISSRPRVYLQWKDLSMKPMLLQCCHLVDLGHKTELAFFPSTILAL